MDWFEHIANSVLSCSVWNVLGTQDSSIVVNLWCFFLYLCAVSHSSTCSADLNKQKKNGSALNNYSILLSFVLYLYFFLFGIALVLLLQKGKLSIPERIKKRNEKRMHLMFVRLLLTIVSCILHSEKLRKEGTYAKTGKGQENMKNRWDLFRFWKSAQ